MKAEPSGPGLTDARQGRCQEFPRLARSGRALNSGRATPGKAVRVCPDAKGWARCQTGRVHLRRSRSSTTTTASGHLPGGTLEPAGFTVAEAATGAEAADAARTIRPGLVPLDIQLPDSDGFEVARRLAAAPAGDPAPVVVLTSTQVARDYGGRTAASPAAGFLPKDQLSGAALRRFLAQDVP